MLFNSLDFAIFLPIVFFVYWASKNLGIQIQNVILITASYVFYGWWDYRFLGLIFLSTVVDFLIGNKISIQENLSKRKLLLFLSLGVNLGLLGYFKYYNFFLDNFIEVFSFFGKEFSGDSLKIILPVGISFYTFQTLSYTIDIYNRKLEPAKTFVSFMAFVCFFPQLVAGPIERATNLLPQFYKTREFNYQNAVDGLRQILWGLFKKVVIADSCAHFANLIFNNSDSYSGSTLLLGAIFFTFQIYGDFSGYSDIAIGTSRMFGFNLKQNFAFPYFSRDIAEFWRRWHISLSTWFRDYLYIPLGGSRGGNFMRIRNTFIIFIVSGFWHGANWTFIFWGFLNALYFLPLMLTNKNRQHIAVVAAGKLIPNLQDSFRMISTFLMVVLAWVFFRADSLSHAFSYLSELFSMSLFSVPLFEGRNQALITFIFLGLFIVIEWFGREGQYAIEKIGLLWKKPLRYTFYYMIMISVIWFSGKEEEFIYFQF